MDLRSSTCVIACVFSLLALGLPAQAAFSQFRQIPNGNYAVPQGRTLQLPCMTERKDPYCLWLRNGNTKLPNAENGRYSYLQNPTNGDCSLTIKDLSFPVDNQTFECQVPSLELSSWPKTDVLVLVKPSSPQIAEKRSFSSIQADRASELICTSKGGNPSPILEWYLNEENITQNASAQSRDGGIESTLIYTFHKRNNASTLVCVVVHPMANQNTTRTLNVLYKPIVSVQQKMYTVNDGDDLDIVCTVDSNPPSKAIWKHNVAHDSQKQISIRDGNLSLKKISYQMDGSDFHCSSQNSVGSSEPESIKLNVLFQPRLTEASQTSNKVSVGQPLRLACTFKGNPKPTVRWNFVDSINTEERLDMNPDHSPENSGLLIFNNISYKNEGDYYCEGINFNSLKDEGFTVRSQKISVDVVGKPEFLNEKDTVIGYRNTNTRIEQFFCSDPPPNNIQWEYGGSVQHTLDVKPKDQSQDFGLTDFLEGDAHIVASSLIPLGLKKLDVFTCFKALLLIRNTDIADARDYILRVKNEKGVVEGIISLEVTSKLSGAMIISISLILLLMLFFITVLFIFFLRRRASKREEDFEEKSDVRVPINDSPDAANQTDEKVL